VLRDAPELGDKPQLRDLLLQRDGHIVTGQIDQSDESALELARVRAPVEVGLGFDQNVDQVGHCEFLRSLFISNAQPAKQFSLSRAHG